ncbi:catalase [Cytophaga hutchinsonii]|uniref:Catalase n=1 Tax=Cytophaga hutchinsonii (strain ATCC 33406 / DSM 1761 / CIP 103989 / NBRC 15051 / NCIMB 9469 / D465) TaxID=269798 RepID=A0A6N4SUU2_CYTH3|nr:catalase [Cytophaga hutchinsonii]ABG60084.1 catalase [Cytophaga hutchinsonii ATCC 33406]SFX24473.1 catalase [Cytophaga hutchinsonii ATCC 33406]
MKKPTSKTEGTDPKFQDLQKNTSDATDQFMTTDQGLKINDDNNSLKAGERGPSLLEDFILREKITHFDHERIPERIVHARGSAAHGYFQVHESMAQYTKAGFLQDPSIKTPVFVRFSTVAGSRGSTDLARDVRGFSVKFYTAEGNYDLVGNNMPVFFIQDAAKFPDLIHAVKPEPHHEMPQAASAHDTFWDFISLMPESMHMIMWVMSDRAIPRSLRMMEGFGVHTFRFINKNNESHFVKFHWKPKQGTHSVVWDEAQKISGKNCDFHRQDLWEAIESGNFPEWELGVQLIPEADEHKFAFDLLDPTKLVPEEEVPVTIIGTMVLNRNPDNFFAETEQVAFHPGHLVPGIDFTNDPLLQGRLFSYTDTQLSRLGSPNFHEIPINRSVAPTHNNQRDGHMRQEINTGRVSYHPNSLGGGCPFQAKMAEGGFTSFNERIDAKKVRERSESFSDHFSQATLFFNSQTEVEKGHIIKALRFELGKVETEAIRVRMVGLLSQIDKTLATKVAAGLGIAVPAPAFPMNHGVGADDDFEKHEPKKAEQVTKSSDALTILRNPTVTPSIATKQIAFLCADEVSGASVVSYKNALERKGAVVKIIAPHLGFIKTEEGKKIKVDQSLLIAASVLFDAVFIPAGKGIKQLKGIKEVAEFITDTYKHCKVIGGEDEGALVIQSVQAIMEAGKNADEGIVLNKDTTAFVKALGKHRFWEREEAV